MQLNKEEKELLESVEQGEWKPVPETRNEAERYQEYAKATFKKDKRVNIRISERDLLGIRKKAIEEGLPYQTLMSSVIHKFVSGRLKEVA